VIFIETVEGFHKGTLSIGEVMKLAMVLFLLLPALAMGSPCTDACDLDYQGLLDECLMTLVMELNWCDWEHEDEIAECDLFFDQCFSDCQGDPDCEEACLNDKLDCYSQADMEHDYCSQEAHSEHYQCELTAENLWIACYADCEGTPVELRNWGTVKTLYR
jgi:hypothetical protein